jgi:hypothetical protein
VIDTATNTLASTVTVGTTPRGIAISPDSLSAYVTNLGSGTVSVLALDTFPAITTATLPDGVVGAPYTATLQTTGTPAPTLSVTAGTLPAGLSLDPVTGALTGTPTTPGSSTFTVTASSSVSGIPSTATQQYTVVIDELPAITTLSLPAGVVGAAYSATVQATGSPAPTFSVTAGALPAGLSLDAVTGAVTGTPTAAGSYTFTVTATNSAGSDSSPYTVVTEELPAITTVTLPNGAVGVAYTATVHAAGSPAPTLSVTAGTLPAGLSLDPITGALTGTPTALGSYTFTVTASNTVGGSPSTADQQYTVVINELPVIVTPTLPNGGVGAAYTATVQATGTPQPALGVTAGALPPGLSLDPVSGALTGTPTTAGSYTFTLSATNSAGSVSRQYTVVIDASAVTPPDGGNGPGSAPDSGSALTDSSGGQSPASLPYTGFEVASSVRGGLALLVIGATLILASRMRRRERRGAARPNV